MTTPYTQHGDEGYPIEEVPSESGPRHAVTNEDSRVYVVAGTQDLHHLLYQITLLFEELRRENARLSAENEALRTKQEGTP